MKKYIKSSTQSNKWKFISVNADYSGGGITIFYGQLADGSYFYGDDDLYDVRLLNADPSSPSTEDPYLVMVSDDVMWQEEHLIRDLDTEKEGPDFWLALYDFCKKNDSISWGYDIDGHIAELEDLKTQEHWR